MWRCPLESRDPRWSLRRWQIRYFDEWEKRQFLALRFCRNRRKDSALKNLAGALHTDAGRVYVIGRPGSQNENSGLGV
jgi:hypothetical protein